MGVIDPERLDLSADRALRARRRCGTAESAQTPRQECDAATAQASWSRVYRCPETMSGR
jgi:hypothetical protein